MASRLEPANRTEHRILGELFARVDDGFDACVAEHQKILDADPEQAGSYHALFELFARVGDHRRARAAAAALVFLGAADTTERDYFEKCRRPVLAPERTVREAHWQLLRHPDLDPYVGVVLEALVEPLRSLRAQNDAALGLAALEEADVGSSKTRVAGLFGGLSRYLRLPRKPRLFICPDRPGGLRHIADADPPATICGATPLSCFDTAQLEFLIARHLVDWFPELSMRTMVAQPSGIATMLRTALHVAGFSQRDESIANAADRLGAVIDARRVPGLRHACGSIAEKDLDRVAVRWVAAAELTTARVGFFVCHDLGASASILRDLPPSPSGLDAREQIRHLVRFSVSDAHFKLLDALASTA
jgi:hypothetical protein